jgi:hypothetical protein
MVKDRVEGLAWLRKQVEAADVDLLREMVRAMAEMLIAEADSLSGAPYGRSGPERVNQHQPALPGRRAGGEPGHGDRHGGQRSGQT